MSGFVVFWNGVPYSEKVDWRAAGQALPAGAVPAIVSDGATLLVLHGHGNESEFGARLAACAKLAEAELSLYASGSP